MGERRRYAVLTRREAIMRAAGLICAAGVAAEIDACSRDDRALEAAAASTKEFFSDTQFQLLDRVADLVIPPTDTPGAIAVGVPDILDAMMANWASDETQVKWIGVLESIDAKASVLHDVSFLSLDEAQQFETLRTFDREALTSGNDNYRSVKDLILLAYYSSEIGATQELRFELVPGAYRGCVLFAEIGRTWAD